MLIQSQWSPKMAKLINTWKMESRFLVRKALARRPAAAAHVFGLMACLNKVHPLLYPVKTLDDGMVAFVYLLNPQIWGPATPAQTCTSAPLLIFFPSLFFHSFKQVVMYLLGECHFIMESFLLSLCSGKTLALSWHLRDQCPDLWLHGKAEPTFNKHCKQVFPPALCPFCINTFPHVSLKGEPGSLTLDRHRLYLCTVFLYWARCVFWMSKLTQRTSRRRSLWPKPCK